jgi:protein TonB
VQDLQRQYLAMVSEALQHHKRYPRAARRRGLSGKVVLAFVILPNGQVTETRIVASQSTRHSILHQAARRALKQASPLPPFPKALKKPSLQVTLPILYELTKR